MTKRGITTKLSNGPLKNGEDGNNLPVQPQLVMTVEPVSIISLLIWFFMVGIFWLTQGVLVLIQFP